MPDSMLARRTTRVGLAVVTMSETWIDPEPNRMSSPHATELPQHVGRSAIDGNSQCENACQRRLVDDVGREHDVMRGRVRHVACPQCSFDLAEGDGVDRDPHGPEEAQDMRVAVSLLGEADAIES
jgi:hypothetical protein